MASLAVLLILVLVGCSVVGSMTLSSYLVLLILAVGLLVFSFICYLGINPVSASHIDDSHVWLAGVCEDYLATLPEWPGTY